MSIDELLVNIRRLPHMYIKLNLSSAPFSGLVNFLSGYESCFRNLKGAYPVCDDEGEILPGFGQFVADYYGVTLLRWDKNILEFEGSEEIAYEKFFQLYSLYRKLPELNFSALYLFVTDLRTKLPKEHRKVLFDGIKEYFPWLFDCNSPICKISPFRDFENYIKQKRKYTGSESWYDLLKLKYSDTEVFLSEFLRLFDEYCIFCRKTIGNVGVI